MRCKKAQVLFIAITIRNSRATFICQRKEKICRSKATSYNFIFLLRHNDKKCKRKPHNYNGVHLRHCPKQIIENILIADKILARE